MNSTLVTFIVCCAIFSALMLPLCLIMHSLLREFRAYHKERLRYEQINAELTQERFYGKIPLDDTFFDA